MVRQSTAAFMAMVAGSKHLAITGPPDKVQGADPWADFEGRASGELHILDSETGSPLGKSTPTLTELSKVL